MKDNDYPIPLFKKGQDIKNTDRLWELWQTLPDGVILVMSQPPRSKTSLDMKAYHFAVIVEMIRQRINEAKDKNYSKEQIHIMLKELFGLKEETVKLVRNKTTGKIEEAFEIRLKSYADYTVDESHDFWEQIYQFASEVLGIVIPDPDPEWRTKAEPDLGDGLGVTEKRK